MSSSGMGRDTHSCPFILFSAELNVVSSQRWPQYAFVEAVVERDTFKPREFSSLENCRERFLWTHKDVDLASHPVVCIVLRVGDTEKFPQALGFENLDPFLRVTKQGPCFTAIEEDGGDNLVS